MSSDNKSIQFLGITGLLYKENETEFYIDSERLASPTYGIVIFTNSVRKKNGGNYSKVPAAENERIISNVIDILKGKSLHVEVMP